MSAPQGRALTVAAARTCPMVFGATAGMDTQVLSWGGSGMEVIGSLPAECGNKARDGCGGTGDSWVGCAELEPHLWK